MKPPRNPPVIAGLLLAAGGGRRLGGRPKALLRHRGRPLVDHAVAALHQGGCAPIHVVLGAAGARVHTEAALGGCTTIDNGDWAEGMGSSLRAGLASLTDSGADAVLVQLVDQPGIGGAAVARVRSAYGSHETLATATYGGRRGHPVLLGAAHWAAAAADARGDQGARSYLAAHASTLTLVECGDVADPADIDTAADLFRLE
ncbi:nucleotidyltransferase family protein [Streptomyces sp. NPDC005963]|uniref:nucleotidyltransferase family protein n=1 Tax=Streptomyces sp. NPDC005963 TaxID=3156721 RepID=UPI003411C2F2